MSQVVLITGASSGIGQACAEYLGRRGYRVYGTSRHANPEGSQNPAGLTLIQMDVNDDASVARGVGLIVDREGRLDVVVNNAGISLVGPIEDATIGEAKLQFETNFFGVWRVCKAALPLMRERGSGHIINISSMAGRAGLPYQGLYSAAKYAVEGMTEALRTEVRHFGIKVVLVEPGDSPTGLPERRLRICRTPAYVLYYTNALAIYEHDERNGHPPEKIAPLIERIIRNPRPRLRYPVGTALQRAELFLTGLAPYSLYERVFARVYKV
jgi:NAD(P)-dependent dehydrogenase (short-subunit alcohol dehydrogenase family)